MQSNGQREVCQWDGDLHRLQLPVERWSAVWRRVVGTGDSPAARTGVNVAIEKVTATGRVPELLMSRYNHLQNSSLRWICPI